MQARILKLEAMPGVTSITWMAVSAPPNTPKPTIQKLSGAIGKGFKEPDMQARILKLEAMPGVTSITWMAVSAPPGTPKPIVQKISDAIGKGFKEPDMQAKILKLEAKPLGSTPDEMRKLIQESLDIWGPVVQEAKITVD